MGIKLYEFRSEMLVGVAVVIVTVLVSVIVTSGT
jgi:hypothetical protein